MNNILCIDDQPQISNAVADYCFNKKPAYPSINRSQQPVYFMPGKAGSRGAFTLYGVNDTPSAISVSFRVKNISRGWEILSGALVLDADSRKPCGRIQIKPDEKVLLLIEWETEAGKFKNHYMTNMSFS